MTYSYLHPHIGGVETLMDALATEYAGRGHEVTVIGADPAKANPRGRSTAYRQVTLPALNILEERLGVPYTLSPPTVLPLMRRELANADLLFAHGFLILSTLGALAVARSLRKGGPTRVLVEHVGHVDYSSRLLDAVEAVAIQTIGRAAVRLSHGAIVCNTRVRRELQALAPRRTIEWIPNGVDVDRYRPPTEAERIALRKELGWDGRPRVLFVGRLVAKKGIDVALATARAGGGAFEVAVVGPGALSGELPSHVQLLGPLAPNRVADLYRAADAFLLPSHGEGFPLTALEALASGLTVFIGEDSSYGPYVALAGKAFRQVPRDAALIARQLAEFFQAAGPRTQAAAEALASLRKHGSWARIADAHLAFAERLREQRGLT